MAMATSWTVFLPLLAFLVSVQAKTIPAVDDQVIDRVNLDDDKNEGVPRVEEDKKWGGFPELQQATAVSVDSKGRLHIFHRGDRLWDANTFDRRFKLTDTTQGPIPNDTVWVVDPSSGKVLYTWGANLFYVPHGLTVDDYGNSWVTDVGMHQVFKFAPNAATPEISIGTAFMPGAGKSHLCQPSDVAVTSGGNFFVSDGYCNSRILMFSRGAKLLKEIGSKEGMVIPHSLALVPMHAAVCVADRENGRVLCFATGEDRTVPPGSPLASIEGQGLSRVYGIDTRGSQLFAVNGPDLWTTAQSISANHGLVIDIESGTPKTLWGPEKGFKMPHDIAVSPNGKQVYVSEIDLKAPKRIYKFNIYD